MIWAKRKKRLILRIHSLLFFALVIAGCEPAHLDLGNIEGADDDPSIVKAQDGSYYLVYLTDRSGNIADLWVTRSLGGIEWSDPVAITNDVNDHNSWPLLLQTGDGVFHLFWNRIFRSQGNISNVMYSRSPNGLDWEPERHVTSGVSDDSAASVVQVGESEFWVYLMSTYRSLDPARPRQNSDIYLVKSVDRGETWGQPVLVQGVSSISSDDRFPAVVVTDEDQFLMAFNRQESADLLDPGSDVYFAESSDGMNWNSLLQVTSDPADLIPDLWPTIQWVPSRNQYYITWTSLDLGGGLLAIPVNRRENYPDSAINFSALLKPEVGGWSARVTQGNKPRTSLTVFVSNETGSSQLWTAEFR